MIAGLGGQLPGVVVCDPHSTPHLALLPTLATSLFGGELVKLPNGWLQGPTALRPPGAQGHPKIALRLGSRVCSEQDRLSFLSPLTSLWWVLPTATQDPSSSSGMRADTFRWQEKGPGAWEQPWRESQGPGSWKVRGQGLRGVCVLSLSCPAGLAGLLLNFSEPGLFTWSKVGGG